MNDYNGWKNRETWNVALWINNDFGMYTAARSFMGGRSRARGSYKAFIRAEGLEGFNTPDRLPWISPALDYSALDAMMKDL